MEGILVLKETWQNISKGLTDPKISIHICWIQLPVSFGIVILSYYLLNSSVGNWSSSQITDNQLSSIICAAFLQPFGFVGILTSLNRLLTNQLYPIHISLFLCAAIAILSFTVGLTLWVIWEGTAYVTFDYSADKPFRMVISCYILFLSCALGVICVIIGCRNFSMCNLWGLAPSHYYHSPVDTITSSSLSPPPPLPTAVLGPPIMDGHTFAHPHSYSYSHSHSHSHTYPYPSSTSTSAMMDGSVAAVAVHLKKTSARDVMMDEFAMMPTHYYAHPHSHSPPNVMGSSIAINSNTTLPLPPTETNPLLPLNLRQSTQSDSTISSIEMMPTSADDLVSQSKPTINYIELCSVVSYFLIFLPLLLVLNGFLPSDWHQAYVSRMEQDMGTPSSAGWVINIGFQISFTENASSTASYVAARNLLASFTITETLYIKLFGDLIVFYGFVMAVSLVSYLAHKLPTIKYSLRRRITLLSAIEVSPSSSQLLIGDSYLPHLSVSVGQILFWALWAAMMVTLIVYWLIVHVYDSDNSKNTLERWARFMGIMAVLFLSFQMFTITRIRLWMDCFQLSFEHLIGFHRFFGYAMLLCSYLHFVLWLIWFANSSEYTLADNGPFAAQPPTYHSDNFTYAYMYYVMIFLVPIAYGLGAYWWVRRNYFEAFYYTHLIASFIFTVAILFHAAQAWRYLFPPLTLYFFDRCCRFVDSTRIARLESLTTAVSDPRNITRLSFTVAQNRSKGDEAMFAKLRHKMGQYCFINIPKLSPYQWHPFTISSAEDSPTTEMTIQCMGEGSWTDELHSLALHSSGEENIELYIDGPYGSGFDFEGYERIVLVAGGIGITPCHSVFATLLSMAEENIYSVPNVDLLWIVRDVSMFQLFIDTFKRYERVIHSDSTHSRIMGMNRLTLRLFCSRTDMERPFSHSRRMVPGTSVMWELGRPDITQELAFVAYDTLIFACGPQSLVNDCQIVADSYGAHFYAENFIF